MFYTVDDYRNAPSGVGPLATEWQDKPHRLVYALCELLKPPLEVWINVYQGAGEPWLGGTFSTYAEGRERGEGTPQYVGTYLFHQVTNNLTNPKTVV